MADAFGDRFGPHSLFALETLAIGCTEATFLSCGGLNMYLVHSNCMPYNPKLTYRDVMHLEEVCVSARLLLATNIQGGACSCAEFRRVWQQDIESSNAESIDATDLSPQLPS